MLNHQFAHAEDGGHDMFLGNEDDAQGQGQWQFGPAVRMDKGIFIGKWIRCALQVEQQPVHGRRKTDKDRRPLAPCPIVRLRILECKRSEAYGGWSEVEYDMAHIDPCQLICAADLNDTALPSTSSDLQVAQNVAQVTIQAQPSSMDPPHLQSPIPLNSSNPIPYNPGHSSYGDPSALPVPYQAPLPNDVTAQFAYATFNDYSDRSTSGAAPTSIYPNTYNNAPAYAPIHNQNTYIPPQFNYSNAQANYNASQLNYALSSSTYYNPPQTQSSSHTSDYDSPRPSPWTYSTPQTYINSPYNTSHPEQSTPISSSHHWRPPSSSSTPSYASHFSPGKHPSYPIGQDTGVVGVFRPKYPRERAESDDSGKEGAGDKHRSKRAAKVFDKRGLYGSLHVQAVKVPSPEGDIGVYFLFTDLTVRNEGSYTIRFRAYDLTALEGGPDRPMVPLVQCLSRQFKVFSPRNFPGLPKPTALAEHFARQGFKLNARKNERQIGTPSSPPTTMPNTNTRHPIRPPPLPHPVNPHDVPSSGTNSANSSSTGEPFPGTGRTSISEGWESGNHHDPRGQDPRHHDQRRGKRG